MAWTTTISESFGGLSVTYLFMQVPRWPTKEPSLTTDILTSNWGRSTSCSEDTHWFEEATVYINIALWHFIYGVQHIYPFLPDEIQKDAP